MVLTAHRCRMYVSLLVGSTCCTTRLICSPSIGWALDYGHVSATVAQAWRFSYIKLFDPPSWLLAFLE